MATPQEHIEEIRRKKFSIGVEEENPLNEDLHHAVRHLSVELYSKDVHFLMEIIQNAEDNEYHDNEVPTLEFVIISKDITGVGASATLLVFNNERGFLKSNIESLCSVGRSTKKGKRNSGYIGEKGIGFKSVFLISKYPHIFSNGYQVKFSETPPPGLKIGYIVPEWVHSSPTLNDIKEIYGKITELPKTILVLPLRHDKVDAVKEQLNNIHPEVILFMSKIKKLTVRDADKVPLPGSVREISVSRETSFGSCRDEKCHSFSLHLSSEEMQRNNEKGYYMWKQRFPVKPENSVEERCGLEEWTITLAFPMNGRLTRESTKNPITNAGIYAFLPTEMVTSFPFIIQSDFILSSSRETILFDNKWNKGIIECIPQAFCKAFLSFLDCEKLAPPISKCGFLKYLPTEEPHYEELSSIRDSIKEKLMNEQIIFCESLEYCSPAQARRIAVGFRLFIKEAVNIIDAVDIYKTSGPKIVHEIIEDNDENHRVLPFFEVEFVYQHWYAECFQKKPNLVPSLSEQGYVKLLYFITWLQNIKGAFRYIKSLHIIKYAHGRNGLGWTSLDNSKGGVPKIYISPSSQCISWLEKWSCELGRAKDFNFISQATQSGIRTLGERESANVLSCLAYHGNITELSVNGFSEKLANDVKNSNDSDFIVRIAKFFFYSYQNSHLPVGDALGLCRSLPVVSRTGRVIGNSLAKKAPPKSVSKLNTLLGTNLHLDEEDVVEISESYLETPPCAYGLQGQASLKGEFLNEFLQVKDIPELAPIAGPLNGLCDLPQNRAMLLIEWVQNHSDNITKEFKKSLRNQKWLKTNRGFKSPKTCMLFDSEWKTSVGISSDDLNFIDESFYEKPLMKYKEALVLLGVKLKFGEECCKLVAKQLEYHNSLSIIIKLYGLLHKFQYTGLTNQKVWIPFSDDSGEWMDREICVIKDDGGLFKNKFKILADYYQEDLLDYFTSCLGVLLKPSLAEYCELWTDWISKDHKVSLFECSCVWKMIVESWPESKVEIKEQLREEDVKLPAIKNKGQDIELKSALEVVIPDHLQLKDLFSSCTSSVYFAWYPNCSESGIAVDQLFSVYSDLGAKYISNAVKKSRVPMTNGCVKKLTLEKEGFFATGMYKTILAFLAEPSRKFLPETRHEIVKTLFDCTVYESEEPFMVQYELPLNGDLVKATSQSHVKFEKDNWKIYIHKCVEASNKLATFQLINEFAEVISSELLSRQSPELVYRLEELLKMGGFVNFQEETVDFMLCNRNLQLFAEDSKFLESRSKAKVWTNNIKGWIESSCLVREKDTREEVEKDGKGCLQIPTDVESPVKLAKEIGDAILKVTDCCQPLYSNDGYGTKSLVSAMQNVLELKNQCSNNGDLARELAKGLGIEESTGEETLKVLAGATFLASFT